MKAFITLDKLFLLFFMCFGGIAYGQQCTHLVIEDLGGPRCNLLYETVSVNFCVSIAEVEIPSDQPLIYAGYSVGGVEYGKIKLEWANFLEEDCVLRACVRSGPMPVPRDECEQEVTITLYEKVDKFTYNIYPIQDYIYNGDIFECLTFPHICNEINPINWCLDDVPSLPGLGGITGDCPAISSNSIDLCCGEEFNGDDPNEVEFRNQGNNPSLSISQQLLLEATPNPFDNQLQVDYQLNTSETVTIQIVDFSGRVVYESDKNREPGKYKEMIQTDELSKGIFYLLLQTSSEARTIKLVKF